MMFQRWCCSNGSTSFSASALLGDVRDLACTNCPRRFTSEPGGGRAPVAQLANVGSPEKQPLKRDWWSGGCSNSFMVDDTETSAVDEKGLQM